jgi:hypothetical protein
MQIICNLLVLSISDIKLGRTYDVVPYGKNFESRLLFSNVYPNICLLWLLSPS